MTIDQIKSFTASGESERPELEETTGTRREAAMTVRAFLNQNGGQALFGVTLKETEGSSGASQILY